ncbi:hypothetical protein IAR55_004545 [Kwoniella newhampshirensis]|uniref:Uncharacterized protein n=1 Tax=Kwoniella newhampshirensis TaxID=1651941 RepID=A0AAW0YKG7_9TREE
MRLVCSSSPGSEAWQGSQRWRRADRGVDTALAGGSQREDQLGSRGEDTAFGAYILSTLQENAGFLVKFSPTDESTRYSTYSLWNKAPKSDTPAPSTPLAAIEHAEISPQLMEYFAFKALPGQTGDEGTCHEMVERIVQQIAEMDYAFKRFLWL